MKALILLTLPLAALTLTSCGNKEDIVSKKDWHPRDASVARHITSVHGFKIADDEGSHLKVEKSEGEIIATFRDDVLEELGGDKLLFIIGWEQNPQNVSRAEYLYFLEALHAYLVLNAPKWDGGEGRS
jgi:hypothetical protein